MTDETTYGRQTIQVVEIEQPRCVNRFGVAPCTATGTPKCYNVYWTCKDKDNYTPDGFIRWRFSRPADPVDWLYETFTDANEIGTNAFPTLISVSESSSKINLGASREGESPLGLLGGVTVRFQDFVFDDSVGDFYLGDRTLNNTASFWSKWRARNPFYPGMMIKVYEGYKGQALADMQSRLYLLDEVDGPDAQGRVTVKGINPLRLANRRRALFPLPTNIKLANLSGLDLTSTDISVTCLETDLSANYGNTGSRRFIRWGSEIIEYTGWTGTEPEFTLTGVRRAQLGTLADEHEFEDGGQRAGRYEDITLYNVAADLLDNHTQIPAGLRDATQWAEEGTTYLSTLKTRATIPEPMPVEELLGELSRDGLFAFWWDERTQKIPLLAVRPPNETPVSLTDDLNIVMDSFGMTRESDDRMTRVTVFYNQRNPTEGIEEFTNYAQREIRIQGEYELEQATGGEIRDNTIYSRWIRSDANSLLLGASLLLRYKDTPEYVKISLDAKDRALSVGSVVDLTTRHIVDIEGNTVTTRWQVIRLDETVPGDRISVEMQSYQFEGKFAIIMANDAPQYADATEEERLSGCWIAENTGLMPDGTEPYLLQ